MNKLLTISDIQQAIQSHTLSLLLIKVPNCGVCTVVENQLKSLLNENQEIYAVQANIGDTPELASYFHALTAPVVILFFESKEVERFARFIPYQQLKTALAKWTDFAAEEDINH
ncbi:thioredoxin family protein [Gallibacterium anatis]|uniref:Thioredoxin n=1 Tax=Gallibacterium anatis TaxID=750 RepID=A0A0A2XFJ7_9PAST|nr:thioredoxin family protein [Gallibacterium anatis]KGQ31131.1 thioredoxin [Gallibacterium anatis]